MPDHFRMSHGEGSEMGYRCQCPLDEESVGSSCMTAISNPLKSL